MSYSAATNTMYAPLRHFSQTEQRSMVKGRPTQIEAQIALRAYLFYLGRGCEPGGALDDWLRAEQELMQQRINLLPM